MSRFLALFRTAMGVGSGRVFSIALFILSARAFSAVDNASFIFAITFPQLLVQLGTLGWLPLIRREISRMADLPSPMAKGFIIRSAQIPMISIGVVAALVMLVPLIRHSPASYPYFLAIAALTVTYSVVFILREYLAALGFPALSVLVSETVPFAFACVTIFAFQPKSVEDAVLLFLGGAILSICIQLPLVWRGVRPHLQQGKAQFETLRWMRVSIFALLGFGGRTILDRLDVIVLTIVSLAADLAYYNSTLRIASLLLLVPVVMLPVFSPHISKAFEDKDIPQLRRDMLLQTFLVGISVLPVAAILLMFPGEITSYIFGEEYTAASHIMDLIVFSQVMFAFSLPWSNFLLMSNGEKIYGYAHVAILALAAAMAFGLVQPLGSVAVALAAATANTLLFALFFGLGVYRLIDQDSRP